MPDRVWRCPIHGEVEGTYDSDGPMSNNVPAVIECEHPHDFGVTIVLGFEDDEEDDQEGDGDG